LENCRNLSDETIIEAIKEKRKNKIALEEWEIFLLHEYWKDWYQRRMKGKRKVTITSFGDVSEKLLSDFDVHNSYLEKEEQKKLYLAIAHLNEREQKIIQLYYFLNLNDQEIADMHGRTIQTIHKQRTVALCKLRNFMI